MNENRKALLFELAILFSKLGVTAFGGPAAHIAMMEQEVVRKRKWISHEEFLDLLGATNLIPGPNSTELAIHLGNRRAGFPGLLIAGSCFIFPALVIVMLVAWAYMTFGSIPQVEGLLYGVKPVIIAVVLQALWKLGTKAVKTPTLAVIGGAGIVAIVLGANELLVLLMSGLIMMLIRATRKSPGRNVGMLMFTAAPATMSAAVGTTSAIAATPFGMWPLFIFFLKVGSVLFGSGYVLLAFLEADLVQRWNWLSSSQLLDAVAVGQVTPGPVFTTATFIGYVLGGPLAALIATVGIFLPAFFFVAVSGPLVPKLRRSKSVGAFLDGVNVASLALMTFVTWQLGVAALVDWISVALALASAALLLKFQTNSAWLVLGGAAVGLLANI